MAIYIKASNQQVLQDAIIKAIHSKKIENWIMTANHYITQNSDLYALRAGFIPHVENNNLIFGILISKNEETKRELYALYHGQFTEMLIKNFYQYFSCIAITSSPEEKYDTPYILDDSLTNLNNLSSCYDS